MRYRGGKDIWVFLLLITAAVCLFKGQAYAEPSPEGEKKIPGSRLTIDESEAKADRRDLLLSVGTDKTVDLKFQANAGANGITISNPKVVATTLVKVGEKHQIVFKPLSAGSSDVIVRDQDGTIRLIFDATVTESDLAEKMEELKLLLQDIEGLNIKIVGEKIVLDGDLLVPADYARLFNVINNDHYGKLVLNLTRISPLALQMLAKRIQDDINAFAQNVKSRVVNGMIFLEGTVDTPDQAERAKEVAKLYLPEIKLGSPLAGHPDAQLLPNRQLVQSFIVINPPPPKKSEKLVRVTFHFVELAKDYTKAFGFKWEPGFVADPQITFGTSQTGSAAVSGPSFTGTISSLFPKLKSAQQAGYARVLKTGTVIVRSGQPASLVETTQFPFTVLGADGAVGTESSDVGLKINVTPLILGQSEDIQMQVKLSQSNLVGTTPSEGKAPITSQHQIDTSIYVKANESAALAGVMSSDVGTDFNKDDPNPGTFEGGGPLFTLLTSKAYRKKKSQFVIFVTPQILENASEGTDDLKKNFRVKVN